MANFIAKGARIVGNVKMGKNVSVWYNAVLRCDHGTMIIGDGCNIQDSATLHLNPNGSLILHDNVSVGHGAIVHGCEIGENTVVGMGAIVMNYAKVGKNCIIGAGALVTENKEIPDGSLVMGVPGRVVRQLTPEEIEHNTFNAAHYVELAQEYMMGGPMNEQ